MDKNRLIGPLILTTLLFAYFFFFSTLALIIGLIVGNVVQPGVTDTPSLRMIPGSETLLQHAALRNPFGRTTRPEEVADVIYLLCRDEAAWINGALIPVDGGEKNQ